MVIVLAALASGQQIALYFTWEKTARDNLGDILARRSEEGPLPTQMCDASTQSWSADFEVLLAFCLDHGRRNFWYLTVGENPCQASLHIIKLLSEIYKVEAQAKSLIPELRLLMHKEQSVSVLNEIQDYLQTGLEEKIYEPNSEFGKAAAYFLKHWNHLTQFVRHKGVPLSNSPSEQAPKSPAVYRKNSYFFRNIPSAFVGDVITTLIETGKRCKTNVQHYLTQLQLHSSKVEKNHELWLPWNYLKTLSTA